MPGFSIWLVNIKKSQIFCSVEAPEKLQETIFFLGEILGLWNTTGYGANWFKLGICWLDSSVFTRKADLSAIHFLNTSLQFVKRCCIIVKKWQGSKIHVVNLLKFHQRTKNSCIQLFPMLTFTCICQRFLFAAFLQIGQVGAFPVCWNLPRVSMKRWLDPSKGSRDLALETSQSCRRPKWCDYLNRLNRLMPPLLWTHRIGGSWDRGWLAGRHETRRRRWKKNSACIAWGAKWVSIFAPKHRGAWSGSCRRVQWPLPMMACWRGKPLESSRPAWNIRSDKIKSYGWRMVEDFFQCFSCSFDLKVAIQLSSTSLDLL